MILILLHHLYQMTHIQVEQYHVKYYIQVIPQPDLQPRLNQHLESNLPKKHLELYEHFESITHILCMLCLSQSIQQE